MVQTTPASLRKVSPALCPLCGQPNQCAMEVARLSGEPPAPCWCAALVFDQALAERIPESARDQVCVCRACAQKSES